MTLETIIGTRPRDWSSECAMRAANGELHPDVRAVYSVMAGRFAMCAEVLETQQRRIEQQNAIIEDLK